MSDAALRKIEASLQNIQAWLKIAIAGAIHGIEDSSESSYDAVAHWDPLPDDLASGNTEDAGWEESPKGSNNLTRLI